MLAISIVVTSLCWLSPYVLNDPWLGAFATNILLYLVYVNNDDSWCGFFAKVLFVASHGLVLCVVLDNVMAAEFVWFVVLICSIGLNDLYRSLLEPVNNVRTIDCTPLTVYTVIANVAAAINLGLRNGLLLDATLCSQLTLYTTYVLLDASVRP